jgi:phage gpG-like protein
MGVKIVHLPPKYAKALKGGLPETMKKASMYLQSSANRKINKGVPPPNSPLTQAVKKGDKTLRDTNQLAQSIAPHSGDLWADASTNLKYARILQFGGIIKSKGKGLWIPWSDKTRSLARRYGATSPRQLIAAMKDDGYSFFYTPLSKVYMAKKGKRGKPFILFLVRGSIKIPARPYMHVDDADRAYLIKLIRAGIIAKLKGGLINAENT